MACLVIELKRVIWEHKLIQTDTDEVGKSLCGIVKKLTLKGDGKAQLFILWELGIGYLDSNPLSTYLLRDQECAISVSAG